MKRFAFVFIAMCWNPALFAEVEGDFGKDLYESHCIHCHGEEGLETSAPIISGMEEEYLYNQLRAFYLGERYDRLMWAMNDWTDELDDEGMRAIAKYVASLNPCDISYPGEFELGDKVRGEELFIERQCFQCHNGQGRELARLDRQKGEYLLYAMASFRTKIRRKPEMQERLEELTDQDQNDLARFFSSNDFCADQTN